MRFRDRLPRARSLRARAFRARAFRAAVACVAILALLLSTSCATWRDVTTVPTYKLRRRALRTRPDSKEIWEIDGRISILRVVDTHVPLHEDPSTLLRLEQHTTTRFIAGVPALVVEFVYMIAASPVLWVASWFALPHWYEEGTDATIDIEVDDLSEWPWWLVTRPVYILDAILFDLPYVLLVFPARLLFAREPLDWKDRISPPESMAPDESIGGW